MSSMAWAKIARGEFVLVGEVPVGGADTDTGLTGDVVEAGLEPALGEHLAGRGESSSRLRAASLRSGREVGDSSVIVDLPSG